jgi:hypothetical protein
MHNNINKAATAQTGESVQTNAAPVQSQLPTAPDGSTTAETASAAASAEAVTTDPQSIAAEETNVATSQSATSVAQPKQEILLPTSDAVSLKDITIEQARSLGTDQLIEECRQRADLVFKSQRRLYRDASNLDVVYEEMVERFRDQNLKGDDRDGKPTLKQAFKKAGWSYEAGRKFHQRYQSWLKKQLITAHENPETLKLTEGDTIKDGGGKYVVKELSDGGTQAVIAKKTEDSEEGEVVAMPLYDSDGIPLFEKVPVTIPTIKVGGLYRFNTDEDGVVHKCVGIREFVVETSIKSLAQEEKEKEAQTKADAEARRVKRAAAKAAEAAKRVEISKASIAAENAARDVADVVNRPDVSTRMTKKAKTTERKKVKEAASSNPDVVAADAVQTFQIRHDVDNTPQGCGLYGSNAPTESILTGTLVACEARRKEILDGYSSMAAVAGEAL